MSKVYDHSLLSICLCKGSFYMIYIVKVVNNSCVRVFCEGGSSWLQRSVLKIPNMK